MEDHPPVFNYLGEEMMQQHLVDVTRSLQSCFEPGSDQYNKLARYTEKVVQKREKWPDDQDYPKKLQFKKAWQ